MGAGVAEFVRRTDVVRRMFAHYEASVCNEDGAAARACLDCFDTGAAIEKTRSPGSAADIAGLRLCYQGLPGVRSALDDMVATWSEMHVQFDHFDSLPDGRVLALAHTFGEDRMGGPIDLEMGFLVDYTGGKIGELSVHLDAPGAIAAARGPRKPTPWADLGSAPQVPATVLGLPAAGRVVLEVAGGWQVEAPVSTWVAEYALPGTPALVYFRENGRIAGWYIPDVQLGIDLRGLSAECRGVAA